MKKIICLTFGLSAIISGFISCQKKMTASFSLGAERKYEHNRSISQSSQKASETTINTEEVVVATTAAAEQSVTSNARTLPFVKKLSKGIDHSKLTPKQAKRLEKLERKLAKTSGDSQVVALILAIFVGLLGIHRFYLGYIWQGVVQLLTGGCLGIWTLIDIIRIATGDLQPYEGSYSETL